MVRFETVLIIGIRPSLLVAQSAGENLGPLTIQALLDSSFRVTILSRQESTSKVPQGVPVVKADYNKPDSLKSAMQGQDVVISMVGGQVAGDPNKFIDAVLAAGVKRFFPSEFGPYSRDPKFAELNPVVLPAKAGTVDYLQSKQSEMSWSSLVTGAWFDWSMRVGFFGFDIASKTVTLIDEGSTVFTATTLSTVGRALAAMLEHPDETKNIQEDTLDVVETVDSQKWTQNHIASEQVVADNLRRLAAEDSEGRMGVGMNR